MKIHPPETKIVISERLAMILLAVYLLSCIIGGISAYYLAYKGEAIIFGIYVSLGMLALSLCWSNIKKLEDIRLLPVIGMRGIKKGINDCQIEHTTILDLNILFVNFPILTWVVFGMSYLISVCVHYNINKLKYFIGT